MQYFYRVAQHKATLNKGDNYKLVTIGTFKSDVDAKIACQKHYDKACSFADKIGRKRPQLFWI